MVYGLDLWKVFFSEISIAVVIEIFFRTAFMYFYTILNIRFILKKHSLSELNVFEMIIIIALASAVGNPMFQLGIPLVYGMITITVVVMLERFVSYLIQANSSLSDFLIGNPNLIIIKGEIQSELLEKHELSVDDLLLRLRSKGIEFVEEVKYAVLEPSGELSVIRYRRNIIRGTSTLSDVSVKE